MSDYKLKPCPFCGGEAHIIIKSFDIFNHGAQIVCKECGARTQLIEPSCDYNAKEKCVRLWNKRAPVVKEQEHD